MTSRKARLLRVVLACVAVIAYSQPLRAEIYLGGKVVEWIIPFSDTGGTNIWARFNAEFLERHLPGQPEVRVINDAGGGGTRGANNYARNARPDGLSILGTSGSVQFPYLLGDPRVRYDFDDWTPIMIAPTGGVVYVSGDLGIESWRDVAELKNKTLVFASQGPTALDLVPMLAFDVLGFDVRYVFGYTGRGEGVLAMRRGEVNIDYQTTPSYLRNVTGYVERGEAVPIMTWGVLDKNGNVGRDPTFPDLPTVEEVHELVHGTAPTGPDYEAYRVFAAAGFAAQKMVVLPKETPDAVLQMWTQTWHRVFDDPDYQARSPQVLGAYPQIAGEDTLTLYELGTNIASDTRVYVREMLESEYSIRLPD